MLLECHGFIVAGRGLESAEKIFAIKNAFEKPKVFKNYYVDRGGRRTRKRAAKGGTPPLSIRPK
jgi:hypothetical protein